LGPEPGVVGQGGLKSSTYDVTHKKSAPPTKEFFLVQARRLAESFKGLNSSLPLSAPELHLCKATCDPVFWREPLDLDRPRKC